MLRKQVRWQLLSDCRCRRGRGRLAVEIRFGLGVSSDERQSPRQSRLSRDHLCWRLLDCRRYDLDGIRSLLRYRHGDYCCRVDQFHGRVSQQDILGTRLKIPVARIIEGAAYGRIHETLFVRFGAGRVLRSRLLRLGLGCTSRTSGCVLTDWSCVLRTASASI